MKRIKFTFNSGKIAEIVANLIITFRNISWPTPKELIVSTLVVLIISAIISAYLLGADSLFAYIRNQLLF
jgi:preprotein translocase SecE subunit